MHVSLHCSKRYIKILASKLLSEVVQSFEKWTSVTTNMWQLRSSHSSYDQAYPAVIINDLFPGVTVSIDSSKFSLAETCNIRSGYYGFSCPNIDRSHDSFRGKFRRRTRCRVDTIHDCLFDWMICAWSLLSHTRDNVDRTRVLSFAERLVIQHTATYLMNGCR